MTFLYICGDPFDEREKRRWSVTLISSHMGDLRHGASAFVHNTSSLVFFEMLETETDSPKPRRNPTKSSVTAAGLVVSRLLSQSLAAFRARLHETSKTESGR